MKKYYIIEIGKTEKELDEMDALELENIEQAIEWIQGSMESDAEYFNIGIKCNIEILVDYDSDLDFYSKALVSVDFETIVTQEMIESEVYYAEDIITDNLTVISTIEKRLVEKCI